MRDRKYITGILTALLAIVLHSSAVSGDDDTPQGIRELGCLECHTCTNPTVSDKCLRPCPDQIAPGKQGKHKVKEAPESLVLDAISEQYGAVQFNHRLHAEMSGMDEGCTQCHHFSLAGKIPPCSDCHGGETNPANLRQPGLKGAYHRQCLGCHREWSHSTACVVCHPPRNGEKLLKAGADYTDIIGIPHPLITEPQKLVYHTPYESGPVVTFYHKEHIELFNLRCVDCHQQENCSYCHDFQRPARLKKTQEEVHAICSGCHGTHRCTKCHDKREKPAFAHADTGWPLDKFHIGLDCRACHPTGKRISKLDSACVSCHGGWNPATFAHSVVGLQLDEIHIELECADCHPETQYRKTPDCAGCHDIRQDPKSDPPGKFISITRR